MSTFLTLFTVLLFALGCQDSAGSENRGSISMNQDEKGLKKAIFAGGCFWCVESDFQKVDGVVDVVSGYTGGQTENPTYHEVSGGDSGHVEAVQVLYDPEKVTYEQLLDLFWRHVDPTDDSGQFVDRGAQYRTAVFYDDEEQKLTAEKSKEALNRSGYFDKPIVTEIIKRSIFYPAEERHQDFYKKDPMRYRQYRMSSGRDRFLKKTWNASIEGTPGGETIRFSRPDDEKLRKQLTPMQYKVTQKEGTEPPFQNEFWDNKEPGIYVDVVSGEPLFLSTDKFDSGTGWPSFTRPIVPQNIVEKTDGSLFMARTEVRSRQGDSHLGHVFLDGREPTGLRYCINSAALRFIPMEDLEKEGYGQYLDQLL